MERALSTLTKSNAELNFLRSAALQSAVFKDLIEYAAQNLNPLIRGRGLAYFTDFTDFTDSIDFTDFTLTSPTSAAPSAARNPFAVTATPTFNTAAGTTILYGDDEEKLPAPPPSGPKYEMLALHLRATTLQIL